MNGKSSAHQAIPNDGHPDQPCLRKNFRKGALSQDILHDQDVGPGLMITGYQVPFILPERFRAPSTTHLSSRRLGTIANS